MRSRIERDAGLSPTRRRDCRGRARTTPLFAICCIFAASSLWAQEQGPITPLKPTGSIFVRPYKAAIVPPIRLGNSPRLRDLIRAGNLYLTVQDAIALTLENSIDLESDRYNALLGQWNLERYQAGGTLPGVPSGSSQASSVVSGQGVGRKPIGSRNKHHWRWRCIRLRQ